MQCDICEKPISLADYEEQTNEADKAVDFSKFKGLICPSCFAKAQAALERRIYDEIEVQRLLEEQLRQIECGNIVDFQAEPEPLIEFARPEMQESFVVEPSEANACPQPDEEEKRRRKIEVQPLRQTDIELLFKKENFRKPGNMAELDVFLQRLAMLLHYLKVDGVIPALPCPVFVYKEVYHYIYFHQQSKSKSNSAAKIEEQVENAAKGLSLLLKASTEKLNISIGEVFNQEGILSSGGVTVRDGDKWNTWESLWHIFEKLIEEIWQRAEEQQKYIQQEK